MKNSFDKYLPVIMKIMILAAGILGQISTFNSEGFMSNAVYLYYTNQSNWCIMAISFILLIFEVLKLTRGEKAPPIPNFFMAIRFVCTVGISLTFVVFSLLLMPQIIAYGLTDYLFSPSNFFVHNLVPILAIIDWCLYGYEYKSKKFSFLLGAILPLYYVVFSFFCTFSGVEFGHGRKVPYFFFDYEVNGWLAIGEGTLGVFYWIGILTLLVLFIGYALILIKDRVAVKKGII